MKQSTARAWLGVYEVKAGSQSQYLWSLWGEIQYWPPTTMENSRNSTWRANRSLAVLVQTSARESRSDARAPEICARVHYQCKGIWCTYQNIPFVFHTHTMLNPGRHYRITLLDCQQHPGSLPSLLFLITGSLWCEAVFMWGVNPTFLHGYVLQRASLFIKQSGLGKRLVKHAQNNQQRYQFWRDCLITQSRKGAQILQD